MTNIILIDDVALGDGERRWRLCSLKEISIIIPCYNAETYIDRCLHSLVTQTIGMDALEIIMINDASTDGTAESIIKWQRQYPGTIKLINLEHNCGQGIARNKALQTVTTPYLGFVDADDWCEPEMYELLLSMIKSYDCDIAICKSIRDDGTVGSPKKTRNGELLIIDSTEKRARNIAYHTMGDAMCDTLSRTSWVKEHGIGFIEGKRYEDFMWSAKTRLYAERICVLEDELYHYYLNLDSTVFSGNMEHQKDLFESAMVVLEYYQSVPEYDIYREAFEFDFVRYFYFQGMQMLANRFEHPDVNVFYWMRETMNILIPAWRENQYIRDGVNATFDNMLALIDAHVTQEDFERFLFYFRVIECR